VTADIEQTITHAAHVLSVGTQRAIEARARLDRLRRDGLPPTVLVAGEAALDQLTAALRCLADALVGMAADSEATAREYAAAREVRP